MAPVYYKGIDVTKSQLGRGIAYLGIPTEASVPLDPDAEAFLTATGITDGTITSAINTLVVDLKAQNVWNKFYAMYPFVGGTATTHKFNLKNPADTNTAYRLNFVGTWVHNANGVTSDGTTAYADTFFTPSTIANWATDSSLALYSKTEAQGGYDMGSRVDVAIGQQTGLIVRYDNTDGFYNMLPLGGTTAFFTNTDGRGFYQIRRTGVEKVWYKNNTKVGTDSTFSSYTPANQAIVLAAFRSINNVISEWAARNYAFMYMGKAFTDSENEAINTIVQNFQTTLGRQV